MRIDLPCCSFESCIYCYDGKCRNPIEHEKCEFIEQQKIVELFHPYCHICGKTPPDRLRELVKADREGRVKILAPAMLAACGSCTSFRRTPGTASGICEKREQFKVFQKRPCCKMYEAREDCE